MPCGGKQSSGSSFTNIQCMKLLQVDQIASFGAWVSWKKAMSHRLAESTLCNQSPHIHWTHIPFGDLWGMSVYIWYMCPHTHAVWSVSEVIALGNMVEGSEVTLDYRVWPACFQTHPTVPTVLMKICWWKVRVFTMVFVLLMTSMKWPRIFLWPGSHFSLWWFQTAVFFDIAAAHIFLWVWTLAMPTGETHGLWCPYMCWKSFQRLLLTEVPSLGWTMFAK